MHNYRRKKSNEHEVHARKAIDGFFRAPNRTSSRLEPQSKQPVFQDRLRSVHPRSRIVGDVRRSDGWHTTDRTSRHVFGSETRKSHASASEAKPNTDMVISEQFVEKKKRRAPKHETATKHESKPRRSFFKRRDRVKRQRPTWKKWMLRGTLGTVAVVLLVGGFLIANGYLNLNKIFQGGGAAAALETDVDPSKLRGEGDGRVNILLMGRGGVGHDGPDLTDTLLVASIDPVNKKAALVSIPRDLWVEGKYSESKINAVFANAKNAALSDGVSAQEAEKQGVRATEKVIENVLGIKIHYYGMIDFRGFERAVNTVGGVDITVPEQLYDRTMAWENNWNPVIAKEGPQTMDGKQALMYVRSRYGSTRGDFDRSERQRLFLMALKNEITSAGTYSNPVKISQLMSDFGDNAKTDFSLNDIIRLHEITKDVTKFDSIGLVDKPHDFLTTDNFSGQSVVVPKAGTFAYADIKLFIRKSLPDGYILRENAPIVVLNGTNAEGLGAKKAGELRSYSYNVTKIDSAPNQNYPNTLIVDLTGNNKYTLNYLERRFNVKGTTELPDGIEVLDEERKGFIIIIGQNEISSR